MGTLPVPRGASTILISASSWSSCRGYSGGYGSAPSARFGGYHGLSRGVALDGSDNIVIFARKIVVAGVIRDCACRLKHGVEILIFLRVARHRAGRQCTTGIRRNSELWQPDAHAEQRNDCRTKSAVIRQPPRMVVPALQCARGRCSEGCNSLPRNHRISRKSTVMSPLLIWLWKSWRISLARSRAARASFFCPHLRRTAPYCSKRIAISG